MKRMRTRLCADGVLCTVGALPQGKLWGTAQCTHPMGWVLGAVDAVLCRTPGLCQVPWGSHHLIPCWQGAVGLILHQ